MAQHQQYQLAEFIEKVKRENYRKSDPYYLDDNAPVTSNRGHKLNRNARQAHHGRLNGNTQFKRRIEHAGYKRNVISLNPPFYTPEGDIVEDESDIDEDDEPLEENIYKDIKLEDILAPLASAADLPSHPSLSRPYKERGLEEMIRNAEDALHREQEILYSIKAIYTEFRGDVSWLPLSTFQDSLSTQMLGRVSYTSTIPPTNGTNAITAPVLAIVSTEESLDAGNQHAQPTESSKDDEDADVDMDVDVDEASKGLVTNGASAASAVDEVESVVRTDYAVPTSGVNGQAASDSKPIQNGVTPTSPSGTLQPDGGNVDDLSATLDAGTTVDGSAESVLAEDAASSTAPSHRMTTRRQANHSTRTPSPAQSVSAASYAPPTDPFFSFPLTAVPDHTMGLPQQMADETCLALSTYISKQEEIVRSFQELHSGLLKALKMRQEVWKWTRAEGHVGEMSDEEDWPDLEEWGIDPRDARIKWTKGQQEDEQVDEEEEKRAKRVRRAGRAKE